MDGKISFLTRCAQFDGEAKCQAWLLDGDGKVIDYSDFGIGDSPMSAIADYCAGEEMRQPLDDNSIPTIPPYEG